ncbi:NAD+ synthase [Thiotrichales bacterium 19S11-10]|nr:NAD+ synthase [Thiotrichales bacterium 19S11-10]
MKVALAQLDYIVGNFKYNFEKIKNTINQLALKSDVLVFSELALSGYDVYDLIDRDGFVQQQDEYLKLIIEISNQFDCAIILGVISENKDSGKPYFNSAVVIYTGEIIYRYHKQLLPTYNIFNEARHFQPGTQNPYFKFKNQLIGLVICEDLWDQDKIVYTNSPVQQLEEVKEELSFVISLNSSPSEEKKHSKRLALVGNLVARLNVPCFYINQVGGYDELVYDGSSFFVCANGKLGMKLDSFKEASAIVDLSNISKNVINAPLLSQNAHYLEQIKLGLKDYVQKCSFQGVVIALSGGIDSALTVTIAVLALGKDKVTAITMPSLYSSVGSVSDSKELCQRLGVKLYERPIYDDYQLTVRLFEESFGKKPSKLTQENMQARIRGRVVMEYANEYGLLAIACGNKSELSVGYATLYGDMNGGINIIGDLYKTDIYQLADYINQTYDNLIPKMIIDKAPSAELSENQKDIDSLPPYELMDALLKLSIEGDLLDQQEQHILNKRAEQLSVKEKLHILNLIDRSEFKRKQAPPIIRLQRRSFGLGRVIPMSQQFATRSW